MPDPLPERGPAFEGEIRALGPQRTDLRHLRARLDRIDAESPREDVRDLFDGRALEGIQSAATLLGTFGRLVEESLETATDRRWLDLDQLPLEAARDAFDVLLIAGLASQGDRAPKNFGQLVTRLTFGADPTTVLFRDVLLGKTVPEDDGLPWDNPFAEFELPFDRLDTLACIRSLQRSFTRIGAAAAGLPRPHPRAGAVVTGLSPNPASAGESVIIRGTGLGAADPAAAVLFGKNVATTTLWTDTEIHAVAPPMQGECCVSIVEQAVAVGDSIGLLLEATAELAGSLGECFGAGGAIAGSRFGKIPFGLWTPEAPCQADSKNALWVGPPRIEEFSANGEITGAYTWRPHKSLTLRWRVARADSVGMTASPQSGTPPASIIPYVPGNALPSGSLEFGALDSVIPWRSRYTLTATNRCGTAKADLVLDFVARIGLIAVSGGMRCAFQSGALSAMGGLLDTEPVVYSGSGFGALVARTAAANFRNAQPLRSFWNSISHPTDLFLGDSVVDQLQTVDGARYKQFLVSAHESSGLLAMGFGSRGGAYIGIPEVNFGEIWFRNMLALGEGLSEEPAAEIGPIVTQSLLGASQNASSSFPWAALIIFALKVGFETGVAVDVRNKVSAALARKGVRDPTPLMAAIDTLVTAAGPLKSGIKIRISLGNLESGDVNYALESGAIVAQPLGSVVSAGSLTEALRASVSTPSWLPAVKIGNRHFVDGATIDPAPIDAVVDAGADHIYILQPNARFLAPIDSFDNLGFVHTERRALQMRERGFLDSSVAPHERWLRRDRGVPVVGDMRIGVELIEATLDLWGLDAFTGDNGLIALWSDYGYLRAFDVIAPGIIFPDASQRDERSVLAGALAANSDNITAARYFAWRVEHTMNGSSFQHADLSPRSEVVPVSTTDGVADMRAAKRGVRRLIDERLRMVRNAPRTLGGKFPPILAVPGDFEAWFMNWEKHYWQTWNINGSSLSPWSEMFGFGDGNRVDPELAPDPIDPVLLTA